MKLLSTLAMLLLFVTPARTALADESPMPNLTGNWHLDAAASDDPVRIMQGAMRTAGRNEGGMGGGRGDEMGGGRGRGRGNSGDRGDRGPSGNGPPDGERLGADMRQSFSSLEIFQSGLELNITDGRDITQLMEIGGRETSVWTEHGEVKATAVWQGDALLVSLDSGRKGALHTRSFQLSGDGSQLIVVEERSMPRLEQTIRIRMIYNRFSEQPSVPDSE